MRMLSVIVLLVGCVSQIRPVPASWDHASDPKCTEDYGSVVADGMLSGAAVAGGLLVATSVKDRDTAGGVAAGGLAVGVVFAISAAIGYNRVEECQRAAEAWRIAQATAARELGRDAPRSGDWFCSVDGSCTHDRATCERPGGSCVAVDAVWCFANTDGSERCFSIRDACWPELRRAGSAAVGACERR